MFPIGFFLLGRREIGLIQKPNDSKCNTKFTKIIQNCFKDFHFQIELEYYTDIDHLTLNFKINVFINTNMTTIQASVIETTLMPRIT